MEHNLLSLLYYLSQISVLNLAVGKPSWQSSTYQTCVASNANDGDYTTYSLNGDPANGPNWWAVDLLSVYTVEFVWVYNLADSDYLGKSIILTGLICAWRDQTSQLLEKATSRGRKTKTMGPRGFYCAVWNSLPDNLRDFKLRLFLRIKLIFPQSTIFIMCSLYNTTNYLTVFVTFARLEESSIFPEQKLRKLLETFVFDRGPLYLRFAVYVY